MVDESYLEEFEHSQKDFAIARGHFSERIQDKENISQACKATVYGQFATEP